MTLSNAKTEVKAARKAALAFWHQTNDQRGFEHKPDGWFAKSQVWRDAYDRTEVRLRMMPFREVAMFFGA